jgi:hypothetical protein
MGTVKTEPAPDISTIEDNLQPAEPPTSEEAEIEAANEERARQQQQADDDGAQTATSDEPVKQSKREKAALKEAQAEAAHRSAIAAGEVQVPVRYTVSLSGGADNADLEQVRKAYAIFVKALRRAGVTVGGTLSGEAVDARHPETGVLVPGTVVHDNAIDVE